MVYFKQAAVAFLTKIILGSYSNGYFYIYKKDTDVLNLHVL